MPLRVPQRYRRNITETYFKIAANLPKRFQIVQALRDIENNGLRDRARLTSEAVVQSRASYDLLGFAFAEIFTVEQAQVVRDNVRALFPERARDEEFMRGFANYGEWLGARSYKNIGRLQREKSTFPDFGDGRVRLLPNLPKAVDYVHVSIAQNLPSVLFMEFKVDLNRDATDSILALLQNEFRSPIELSDLRPWIIDRGYTTYSADNERTRVIATKINQLATQTQSCLRFGLKDGYFTSRREPTDLPRVEIYSLNGISADDEAARTAWLQGSYEWRSAVGLDLESGSYDAPDFVLLQGHRDWDRHISPWRLALKPERYADHAGMQDPRIALLRKLSLELSGLLSQIAITRYQDLQEQTLGKFRFLAYRAIKSNSPLPGLRRYTGLFERILSMRVLMQRLREELKRMRSWIESDSLTKRITSFQMGPPGSLQTEKLAGGWLLDHILKRFDLIWESADADRAVIADLLSVRNISSSFTLTTLLVLATIAGLIGWDTIRSWIKLLLHAVHPR